MSGDPLESTEGLKPGDVVQYSLHLRSRQTGEMYWHTRFAAVTKVIGRRSVEVLTLVPNPDPKYEPRTLRLGDPDTVVTFLPEDKWPQGVMATRMKHVLKGAIKLGEG